MAKQDEWARITLRLPQDLHQRLIEAAGPRSLNAEIVDRLEKFAALDALRPSLAYHKAQHDHLAMELEATKAKLVEVQQKERTKEAIERLRLETERAALEEVDEAVTRKLDDVLASRADNQQQQTLLKTLRDELFELFKDQEASVAEQRKIIDAQAELIEQIREGYRTTSSAFTGLLGAIDDAAEGRPDALEVLIDRARNNPFKD